MAYYTVITNKIYLIVWKKIPSTVYKIERKGYKMTYTVYFKFVGKI